MGLWLGAIARAKAVPVATTTRIGLSREMHRLLRFYEPGSAFVSGPRKLLMPGGSAVDLGNEISNENGDEDGNEDGKAT
jgi:DNA-3-methyladenine glycosylase